MRNLLILLFCVLFKPALNAQVVFDEPFDEVAGSTAGIDNAGGVAWTASCVSCLAGDWFEVSAGGFMEGLDTNGPAAWETGVIDISSCPYFEINFDLSETGTMEACGTGCNSVDYVQLEYNIDATGWQVPSNSFFCAGACADVDVIHEDDITGGTMAYTTGCIPGGSTLQIRITVQCWSSAETWEVDNVIVQCSSGPSVDAGLDQTVCQGASVTLTASNPDGATISWDNGVNDGVPFAPSLGTLTYTVTADLGGCMSTDQVDVTVLSGPTFNVTPVNATTCVGTGDGALVISGLTPGASYDITYFDGIYIGPITYVADGSGNITIPSLQPGSYTDVIVDSSGCFTIDQNFFQIVAPGTPGVNAGPDLVICEGDPVTLIASNPDGATITWDNGVTDGVPFTPSVGTLTYTVTATDPGSSCDSTDQMIITVNPSPTASVNPAGPFLVSGGTQTISASPGGGTWSADCGSCIDPVTGVFDPAIAGLGTWQVCYTVGTPPCDDQECISVFVTDGCLLSGIISSSNPTCYQFSDGSVTINMSGGAGTLTFTITNSGGTQVNVGNSNAANNLPEGWYYFNVTDQVPCTFIDSVFIEDPGQISVDLDITNPLCWGQNTGIAIVDSVYNATGNYGQIGYFWTPNPGGTNGIGADTLTSLTQGVHNLIINDENGCSESFDFNIDWPDSLFFQELGYDPAYCRLYAYQSGNGVAYASADGGSGSLTYQWMNLGDSTTTPNTTWGGLNPGQYQITVTDANGCILTSLITMDSLNPQAIFEPTSAQFSSNNEGTAPVTVQFENQSLYFANPNNPTADTTFFWNFNYDYSNWIVSHDYYELFDTTYALGGAYEVCLVAINKNGCTDTSCVTIVVHEPLTFVPVNIFTPNGDGVNEVFTFNYLAQGVSEFSCTIVNRWGRVVHEMSAITDEWNGEDLQGDPCVEGIYFYTYEGKSENGESFAGQGNVQLIRYK